MLQPVLLLQPKHVHPAFFIIRSSCRFIVHGQIPALWSMKWVGTDMQPWLCKNCMTCQEMPSAQVQVGMLLSSVMSWWVWPVCFLAAVSCTKCRQLSATSL